MLGNSGGEWLTRLHMMMAQKLLSSGWSQAEVASILGTTQSTISRQLQRPLPNLAGSADEITIDKWAHELSSSLIQMGPTTEVLRQRIVTEFQFTGNQVIRFDTALTGMELDEDQIRTALLRRLEWSSNRLSLDTLTGFIPAVGMNIAACPENANDVEDVCAFPGRLTTAKGAIRPVEPAAYGASNHLASVLINARKKDNDKGAIINLRPLMKRANETEVDMKKITKACEEFEWAVTTATKGSISRDAGFIDVIVDPGDFGWEPTLYILANNPLELVERAHNLISSLR